MAITLKRFRNIKEVMTTEVLIKQGELPLYMPREAFPGQDLSCLRNGLHTASIKFDQQQNLTIPSVELRLYTVENGLFFLDHGLDGMIVTEDGFPIHETAAFRKNSSVGKVVETVVEAVPTELGEVFLGFDGAWRNYYHWMCFGLVKTYLAARFLSPSTMIAIPSYSSARLAGPVSFSEATYNQSLELSGLTDRVTMLPRGVYRARKLHFFWTEPTNPTDLTYLAEFYEVFAKMKERAATLKLPMSRVYLSRSPAVANRIDVRLESMIAEVVERNGFEAITFEGTDLRHQISVFSQAQQIVSPHGAGLTNCLFGGLGMKVLELNRSFDEGNSLRPWFFLLCSGRGHEYFTLDTGSSTFSEDALESALEQLLQN